jgi:hypothetical protein
MLMTASLRRSRRRSASASASNLSASPPSPASKSSSARVSTSGSIGEQSFSVLRAIRSLNLFLFHVKGLRGDHWKMLLEL